MLYSLFGSESELGSGSSLREGVRIAAEQVKPIIEQGGELGRDYWFIGPVLLILMALVNGYRTKVRTKAALAAKDAAVEEAKKKMIADSIVRAEAEAKKEKEKVDKERKRQAEEAIAAEEQRQRENCPIFQAKKKIARSVLDAVSLGHLQWTLVEISLGQRKIVCKNPNYSSLEVFLSGELGCPNWSFRTSGEDITTIVLESTMSKTILSNLDTMFTTLRTASELARLSVLARKISPQIV